MILVKTHNEILSSFSLLLVFRDGPRRWTLRPFSKAKLDLVETDSYSPVSSKFEKQSRMCFDQIHMKPTFYRPFQGGLLGHMTS